MADVLYTELKDKTVQDFIKNMDKRLKDIKGGKRKYTGLLSAIVFKDVQSHFTAEEGPKGPWAKWSPSYVEQLKKAGRAGNKKLQYTGKLRQNFKPTDVKSSARGILWFNDAVTKSGYPYAAGHNDGDGQLPQREFMWLSGSALDDINVQTLQFMIDEGV